MKQLVVGAAALIALARFFVEPGGGVSWSGSYEAVAHVYVGGLFGAWLVDRKAGAAYFWTGTAISAVEVFCAVAGMLGC